VEVIAWALSVPAPKLSLPAGLLLVLAGMAESAGRYPAKSRADLLRVKLLSENYTYSIEKARSELDSSPWWPWRQGSSTRPNGTASTADLTSYRGPPCLR